MNDFKVNALVKGCLGCVDCTQIDILYFQLVWVATTVNLFHTIFVVCSVII